MRCLRASPGGGKGVRKGSSGSYKRSRHEDGRASLYSQSYMKPHCRHCRHGADAGTPEASRLCQESLGPKPERLYALPAATLHRPIHTWRCVSLPHGTANANYQYGHNDEQELQAVLENWPGAQPCRDSALGHATLPNSVKTCLRALVRFYHKHWQGLHVQRRSLSTDNDEKFILCHGVVQVRACSQPID